MAGIKAKGIEGLQLSMQEVAAIPEDVIAQMLNAGGKVVVSAHQAELSAQGLIRTGKLRQSITALPKRGSRANNWNRYVVVYPSGQRGQRHRRQVTKTYARSKSGRTRQIGGDIKPVYNSEVGFIYEYGAPKRNIRGRKWMEKANQKCADNVAAAEMRVYDSWLTSKNL